MKDIYIYIYIYIYSIYMRSCLFCIELMHIYICKFSNTLELVLLYTINIFLISVPVIYQYIAM